jgi:hypothetical protein
MCNHKPEYSCIFCYVNNTKGEANMKIPKKYHKIITEQSIDIDPDGSLFVWLNYGFCYDAPGSGSHCQGFDTLKDAIESMKTVYRCKCKDCSEKPVGSPVAA